MRDYPSLDKAINYFKQDFRGVSTWHNTKLFVKRTFQPLKMYLKSMDAFFFFSFRKAPHYSTGCTALYTHKMHRCSFRNILIKMSYPLLENNCPQIFPCSLPSCENFWLKVLSGSEMGEGRHLIDSFYCNAKGCVCSWYVIYKKTKYQ